jgi:hypothetical protein
MVGGGLASGTFLTQDGASSDVQVTKNETDDAETLIPPMAMNRPICSWQSW